MDVENLAKFHDMLEWHITAMFLPSETVAHYLDSEIVIYSNCRTKPRLSFDEEGRIFHSLFANN